MSKFREAAIKAKSNWVRIALFFWILWVTASLQKIERDTEHVSGQISTVAGAVAEKANSDEVEQVRSDVEDVQSSVDNLKYRIN